MMRTVKVSEANNRAARLIDDGQYDEAARVLDEVGRELAARPRSLPDPDHLDAAFDEIHYLMHRILIGWHFAAYADTLPHAQRAYELEQQLVKAVSKTPRDASQVAFSTGAWGLISVLTRLGRFEDAARVFDEVVSDQAYFWARHRRDAKQAERLLVGGLCVYFERKDPKWLAKGKEIVRKAQELVAKPGNDVAYGFACFWALVGETERAFEQLQYLVDHRFDLDALNADADFRALHADPRWETLIVARVLPFKILSEPAGARVFFDEHDTGLVTPARIKGPPKDARKLRLVLDGYRDTEIGVEHLEYIAMYEHRPIPLLSHAALAAHERVAQEFKPLSISTRELIGDRRRANVVIQRHTTYGLGGVTAIVHGDGRVELHKLPWGEREQPQQHTLTIPEAAVDAMFDALIAEELAQHVVPEHTGVPDEIYVSIALTGGAGQARRMGKFARCIDAALDRMIGAVVAAVRPHLDATLAKQLTFF